MNEKISSDEAHRQDREDAATFGDNAAVNPPIGQEWSRRQKEEIDDRFKLEELDWKSERLYQLMQQEGIIDKDDSSEKTKNYSRVNHYVEDGFRTNTGNYHDRPDLKEFDEKMAAIHVRDEAGEWEPGNSDPNVKDIPKAAPKDEAK